MPLSEHEKKILDSLEQDLAYTPDLPAPTAGWVRPEPRRIVVSVLLTILGVAVLITGVATRIIPVGVAGFTVMLAAASILTRRRN